MGRRPGPATRCGSVARPATRPVDGSAWRLGALSRLVYRGRRPRLFGARQLGVAARLGRRWFARSTRARRRAAWKLGAAARCGGPLGWWYGGAALMRTRRAARRWRRRRRRWCSGAAARRDGSQLGGATRRRDSATWRGTAWRGAVEAGAAETVRRAAESGRRTASSTQRSSEAASSEAASVRHSGRWETRTPTMCEKARLLCFPPVCILELELVTAKRSVENSQPFDGWPYAA